MYFRKDCRKEIYHIAYAHLKINNRIIWKHLYKTQFDIYLSLKLKYTPVSFVCESPDALALCYISDSLNEF